MVKEVLVVLDLSTLTISFHHNEDLVILLTHNSLFPQYLVKYASLKYYSYTNRVNF